jgi:transcriptional regulator with XRE-family HTH domain
VPETGSPTARRRELGTQLRALRKEKGWTAQYVADRLEISASKVSRLETGQRGVRAQDIRALCDLYQVPGDRRQQLTELAAEGKQRAMWQPLALPYTTYLDLESEATCIQDYGLALVPGLLQTSDYASETVRAAVPRWSPQVIEQRVEGRLARQQILLDPGAPQYQAVMDESVLHRVVGSPSVMLAQLKRLLEASYLSTVTVRVIPYESGQLPVGNNKFILLTFARSALTPVVFIEGLTGDLYLDRSEDVKVYSDAFAALCAMAHSPEETRELITAKITHLELGLASL